MIEKNEISANARGGTELFNEDLEKHLDASYFKEFQIIPTRVRELDPNRKSILVVHETPFDQQVQHLSDPESRKRFAGIVFISNWQKQMFNTALGVPLADSVVLKHAIEPVEMHEKTKDGPIRLVYNSMLNRGLGILVPVFEHMVNNNPDLDIHLDVYSSFKTYGNPLADRPFQELINRIIEHPKMSYHGHVPNEELRENLKKSHIHAYPNIYAETFCRAALETLSAGLVVVAPNYAVLPETCAAWAAMYEFAEDPNEHANRFYNMLLGTILTYKNADPNILSRRQTAQMDYYSNFYNWQLRKNEWESYLNSKRG